MKLFSLIAGLSSALAAFVSAGPVDILGSSISADSTLYAHRADNNTGGDFNRWVERTDSGLVRRALLRFNVSTIQRGSTVSSATVSLTINRVPFAGAAPAPAPRAQ